VLSGGEQAAPFPGLVTPGESPTVTYKIGSWGAPEVGFRDCLDTLVKRKLPLFLLRITMKFIGGPDSTNIALVHTMERL
jgi:hypothetical protein